jgi:hypothetical protein
MSRKKIEINPATETPTKQSRKKVKKKPRPPKPTGRPPSAYNDKTANYILIELMKGRTLTKICNEADMPPLPIIYGWLSEYSKYYHEEFSKSYREAREVQADTMADQIIDIAADGENDTYTRTNPKTGQPETAINFDYIQRSRLRVDAMKWKAAHLLPRKYSERMQLTGAEGKDLIPTTTTLIVNFTKVDKAE